MWLAMLLTCSTPEAFSCITITQPNNLFYSEKICMGEVLVGIQTLSPQAFYVNGGCIKIGSSA